MHISEACISDQNGDRAWGVYYRTEGQRSIVRFLWAKELNARMFINKCFQFTVGSVCRVKRFTTGPEIISRTFENPKCCPTRRGSGWDNSQERLLCCRFRRPRKVMRQVHQCWWRICWEINVFFYVRIWHVLRFISTWDQFTDPRIYDDSFNKGNALTDELESSQKKIVLILSCIWGVWLIDGFWIGWLNLFTSYTFNS
jgi:hypothetical protein